MILKSRRLFYVPERTPDPLAAPAAGLWARDTRFLDPVRVSAGATLAFDIGDSLVCEIDAPAGGAIVTLTADFRDLFEVRGWKAQRRGRLTMPEISAERAVLGYMADDGHLLRSIVITDPGVDIVPVPGGVEVAFRHGGRHRVVITPDLPPGPPPSPHRRTATIHTSHRELDAMLTQSSKDLAGLETEFPDGTLLAAGVPWYVAPFGRDVLIGAWQTLHIDPHGAAAALRALAAMQGRDHDPFTSEQPGKIIHEARYGELARLGEIPQHPYYGSVDSTPLFLMVAAETLAWGNDPALAADLAPAMEAALGWVDTWGDPDGDGLIEYPLEPDPDRVPALVARHEAWKDSADSLHHLDGSEPHGLIASVEVQGYLHRALLSLADLTADRGDQREAAELADRASRLADRVDRAFWMDSEQWYAQALDGRKAQVASVASNAGQLLFSGMVPPDRAATMARRMLRPDLFSGWGLRTLSTAMPHYDPLSYHNGSVWPHDNGIVADGCYLTGHPDPGEAIFAAVIALAAGDSLAELYSGEAGRVPPAAVGGSCRPQAWAAGVAPQLVRSCLGLRPNRDRLLVTPALPSFLDRVEIEGLAFQGTTGDLLVARDGNGYRVESTGLSIEQNEV